MSESGAERFELPDMLPCPFCGSCNADIEEREFEGAAPTFVVACDRCGGCAEGNRHRVVEDGVTGFMSRMLAIKAWNRRAVPDASAGGIIDG